MGQISWAKRLGGCARRGAALGFLALTGVALAGPGCRRAPPPQPATEAVAAEPSASQQADGQAKAGAPAKKTCPSWQDLDPSTLAPAPDTMAARVLLEIWEKLRIRHFDPTLNCLDWVALRDQYIKKVGALRDQEEIYAAYNDLLAKLDQSHLAAVPPAPLIKELKPNRGPAEAQVHWTWHDGRLYLRAPRPGEFEVAKGLRSGEIRRIDGVLVTKLFGGADPKKVGLHPSRDALDTIERAMRTEGLMSCPEGGFKRLEIARPGKGTSSVKVRCESPEGPGLTLGKLKDIKTEVRAKILDPKAGVGYLAFNIWMLPMLGQLRATMQALQAQGMKSLILDLRGNPGGVASMTIPVARLMWPSGGSLGTIYMRDFRQDLQVRPNPKAFAGEIVLLIDDLSASTTEIFALGMRAAQRVKIIAAGRSSGMALASIIEGLSDGGLLQYVIGRYQSPASQVAEGRGVAPDRLVSCSEADLHAQRDPVLNAALKSLGSSLVTPL